MNLSRIATSIGESATLRLNQVAAGLRRSGEAVIHLGGGEPRSKAPAEAIESAAGLLQTREVRYAPPDGIPSLKDAVASYTEEFYARPTAPREVIVSGGAKQALIVCLQAILDPGDELVFPAPYWVSYPEMVRLVGGVGIAVAPGDGGFVPSLEDIEKAVGPRCRAVILNSPNNPSGAVYSADVIADVVGFCEARGLWLIMDDIYHRLVFDRVRAASCWDFARDRSDRSRLVIINGVSKQYAMTGFRIGWAVGNPRLIEAMTNIQSHQSSGPSTLSQAAAEGALRGDRSSVEGLRLELEGNRDVLLAALAGIPGVRVAPPQGTFYCFPDFRAHDADSVKLAASLLDRAKVVTVPGVEFGFEGHLRLSFCGDREEIREGIARIRWALDPEAPREILIGGRAFVRED